MTDQGISFLKQKRRAFLIYNSNGLSVMTTDYMQGTAANSLFKYLSVTYKFSPSFDKKLLSLQSAGVML